MSRLTRAHILLGPILALALAGCIAPSGETPPEAPAVDATTPVEVAVERFEGKLVCGFGTPAGTMNPCLFTGESRNVFDFDIRPGIETLLVGLTWEATTLLGKDLQLLVESHGFNTVRHADAYRYGSASGKADLVVRVDAAELSGTDWSWDDLEAGQELQSRVFPARTLPPSVVVEQPFVIQAVVFYGAAAPDDADPFAFDEAADHTH